MDTIVSFAPATIANVGPCFDIMGYALNYAGDFAEVSKVDGPQKDIVWDGLAGPHADALSDMQKFALYMRFLAPPAPIL